MPQVNKIIGSCPIDRQGNQSYPNHFRKASPTYLYLPEPSRLNVLLTIKTRRVIPLSKTDQH